MSTHTSSGAWFLHPQHPTVRLVGATDGARALMAQGHIWAGLVWSVQRDRAGVAQRTPPVHQHTHVLKAQALTRRFRPAGLSRSP
jgi:hypothetical protein